MLVLEALKQKKKLKRQWHTKPAYSVIGNRVAASVAQKQYTKLNCRGKFHNCTFKLAYLTFIHWFTSQTTVHTMVCWLSSFILYHCILLCTLCQSLRDPYWLIYKFNIFAILYCSKIMCYWIWKYICFRWTKKGVLPEVHATNYTAYNSI